MVTTWNKVPKPSGGTPAVTIQAGEPIGLLLALTYATSSITPGTSAWTKVAKQTSTAWTKVTKAT